MITHENNLSAGKRALLIEPEDETRRALQLLLQGWRYEVRSFRTPESGLADTFADKADVLLLAHCLPEGGAAAALGCLRLRGWSGRAILIVAQRSPALIQKAHEGGFGAILAKPIGRLELLNALVK